MTEEFLDPWTTMKEFFLGKDSTGVHLIEATVVFLEGFHDGEAVEVEVTFHVGKDDGVAVGAEVLEGVADFFLGDSWEKLDKDGHCLVHGRDITFIQETGGGFGVEDFGANVEVKGWGVLGAPGGSFLQAVEVLRVGKGMIAGGDVGGADEVAGAGVRGLAEEGVHVVGVFGSVIYVVDHVGVHFY